MKARNTRSLAVGSALALLVAGCATTQSSTGTSATTGASAVGSDGVFEVITVSSTATECAVSTRTTRSGTATFSVRNSGPQITEFYLLGPDGLRIVAEKENIAPGGSADLTVTLQPGSYFTACKPGMRGANVGEAAFSVTGERVQVPAEDKQLFDQAVRDYVNFVKNEVAEFQPKVEGFVAAYVAGDDEQARRSYAAARVHYERIEPIAEALGLLDPRIDYREIDYLAEAEALAKDDPTFTEWLGFHRMEKDLWVPAKDAVQPDGANAWEGWTPSTPEVRARIGSALKADVGALYDKVHAADFVTAQELDIAAVANGASALLEEIAVAKVTGEEDWWSHTDLWDFQANLQGSRIAFDLVAPIATRKGPDATALAASISREFDALQALLSTYGNLTDGFVLYNTVSRDQQRALAAQIDAVREPLSKITNTVLGAAG